MSTFYLDLEGGSDAADGTTFANRWKTFENGATAARIAPGDVVRVMASLDPVTMNVTGTIAEIDYVKKATYGISSSTNATPISVTTSASHPYATGDVIAITNHATNTAANGVWVITVTGANTFTLDGSVGNGTGGSSGNCYYCSAGAVKLSSAVTANIASYSSNRTAWTASANVTCAITSNAYKEPLYSDNIAIAAGFTTGKAAYKQISTLNLSGYQRISFWIRQSVGTIGAASDLTINLCSDTSGNTIVDTFNLPQIPATFCWQKITIDKGSALGSSIKSVRLTVNVDRGAQTFQIANILVCKAESDDDALTLDHFISFDSAGPWFPIHFILGDLVVLESQGDNGTTLASPSKAIRVGAAVSAGTLYKRIPIPVYATGASSSDLRQIMDSGSIGSPITFQGGWDRTAMSTRSGDTYIQCMNSYGAGLTIASRTDIVIDALNFCRFNYDIYATSGMRLDFKDCNFIGSQSYAIFASAEDFILSGTTYIYGGNYGLNGMVYLASCENLTIVSCNTGIDIVAQATTGSRAFTVSGTLEIYGMTTAGSTFSPMDCIINNYVAAYSVNLLYTGLGCNNLTINNINLHDGTTGLIGSAGNIVINGGIIEDLDGYGISTVGNLILNNVEFGSMVGEVNTALGVSLSKIYSQNHDDTPGNHKIWYSGLGLAGAETSVRHTASGIAWYMQPTTTECSERHPVQLKIVTGVLVETGNLVTVTAWMRRDDTGLTMRLICKGGQIAGVATDVSADMTAAANTWEQVSITFTPSETGVVEIYAQAFGGTTYTGYVDDVDVAQ